jgi:hypothetical protein
MHQDLSSSNVHYSVYNYVNTTVVSLGSACCVNVSTNGLQLDEAIMARKSMLEYTASTQVASQIYTLVPRFIVARPRL